VGHAAGRFGRRLSGWLFEHLMPASQSLPLPDASAVRSVLLVRPNFRIGNTLMAAPLVLSLRERFPHARVDVLTGETTVRLLEQLPIDGVHAMSRLFVLRPWRFVSLFVRLRRARFDLALEAGLGSFSGGMYCFLSGARHRAGCEGSGARFLNVRFPAPSLAHAYDGAPALARCLGATCVDRPVYRVSDAEGAVALRFLAELALVDEGCVRPFVGLFIGGHLNKRWPREDWLELARALDRVGVPFVVFLGPEEALFEQSLREALSRFARVVSPQPIRVFAALVARARLLVTPDSGPMHLAAAVGVPTISVLRSDASRFYAPRGSEDRMLVGATPAAVLASVVSHAALARSDASRAQA
jgi:heptosyltransferase-3